MEEEKRLSPWNIETYIKEGNQFWICFREHFLHASGSPGRRIYDTKDFLSKEEAVLRCRSLNAMLVQDSWMADGHPQNW